MATIDLKKLAQEVLLHPQESLLAVKKNKASLFIGLPKEKEQLETRLALRPEAVQILVNNGHSVIIEAGAGNHAKHYDKDYSDAGAKITYNKEEVFQADYILKIAPPDQEEIALFKGNQTLISVVNIHELKGEYLQQLAQKKICALGFEFLEDAGGELPFVRVMSEIAGSTVMFIAAELLSIQNAGKGIILGGISGVPPSKVVILGAGTVAEYASRSALGLGAEVKVFDNQIYRLRRLKQTINQPQLFTSTLETNVLKDAISRADVLIGALRAENGRTPAVVTEEMIAAMQSDSVAIDVSIDSGGCFETSRPTTLVAPTFKKHGVIHYCMPNIASKVPRTATTAISNIMMPLLLRISDLGGVNQMILQDKGFAKGVYTYRGEITNATLAERFHLRYRDLRLLSAAFEY